MIQKYSLKDFLTNEIELISKDSNYQKIKIHKIEIPMIQRDYAQGRSTVSSKKKNAESKLNSTGEKFIRVEKYKAGKTYLIQHPLNV